MEISQSFLKIIAIISISPISIITIILVFKRLKDKELGFGPFTLKLIGLIIFVSMISILVISTDSIKSEVLAALLGTVAGYVLSNGASE